MASSSSYNQQNERSHGFSAIEPSGQRRKVSESRSLYEVFINHRGPDVKHTLALQLYNSLQQLEVRAFLDSEEKQLGVSFPSTIENAIRSASVHIAIFSKGYAESAWCLEELVLMLKSQAKIIPVFYDVKPSDLRHIESGVYANAFARYKEKSRYLDKQLEEWKKALQTLSYIAGEEFYKSHECNDIVSAVQKEVERKKSLYVAKYPVGLHKLVQDFENECLNELGQDFENECLNELVQDFERHCALNVEKKKEAKAKAVGIFGMGGSGKTTLSKELFNRKHMQYTGACFLFDMREASAKGKLPSLQIKLIEDIFQENAPNFQSIEEGTSYISGCIKKKDSLSFLIILDDIDHVQQLDALLIRDLLDKYSNSLVIVTTRDVGVLISTGISTGYNLKGMHRNEARELFCWHAFEQPQPASGYEDIVGDFIDVCGGLPLSLQVLGRHVFGRDLAYWRLQVEEARKTMHKDVLERLKISFDALNREEKEIFMDIACFFIDEDEDMAIKIWKGCGWSAQRAVQTLKDKCLVTKGWRGIKMHDHLRDLGREIAREINAPRRPWRPQILKYLELKGFQAILSQGNNVRCFQRILDRTMDAEITYFIGNSEEDWNETSASLLWLELDLQGHTHTSIPSWIPLQNLHCLKIRNGNLKRLWQTDVQTPSSLKELNIKNIQLEELPDLSEASFNHLEKVFFYAKMEMTFDGWSFLESLIINPTSVLVQNSYFYSPEESSQVRLSNFKITGVLALNNRGQSLTVKFPMSSLEKLEIADQDRVTKVLISGSHYPNFKSLHLRFMENLTEVDLNMVSTLDSLSLSHCRDLKRVSGDLKNLVELDIKNCQKLEQLPCLFPLRCLKSVQIYGCGKLDCLEFNGCTEVDLNMVSTLYSLRLSHCRDLKRVSGDLKNLVELDIRKCQKLEQLPCLFPLRCLKSVHIYGCGKLDCLEFNGCTEVDLNMVSTLDSLRLSHCRDLKRVSGDLKNLVELDIRNCQKLEQLPCLFPLRCLNSVNIDDCEKLNCLEFNGCTEVDLNMVSTLDSLRLSHCRDLKRVSGDLKNLVKLDIRNCQKLEQLPCLFPLRCLKSVYICGCEKLNCLEFNGCTEVDLNMVSTLDSLSLSHCRDLKRVSGDLKNLVKLYITNCQKLEQLPCLFPLRCLKSVYIYDCEKLNCLEFNGCTEVDLNMVSTLDCLNLGDCINLKRVSGDLTNLVNLYIIDCPELEQLRCLFPLRCLKSVYIYGCEKLNCLEFNGCTEVDLNMVSTLDCLNLGDCINLKRVSGDLTNLVNLYIIDCPELEQLRCLFPLRCLKSVYIYGCEKLNCLEFNGCTEVDLNMVSTLDCLNLGDCINLKRVSGDLTNLVNLYIIDCPELEQLPCLFPLRCLKSVYIYGCEKLNCLAFNGCTEVDLNMVSTLDSLRLSHCRDLKRVSGDLTNLVELQISGCSELEELPCLFRLSCLRSVNISGCEKLNCLQLYSCTNLRRVKLCDLPKLVIFSIRHCLQLEELPEELPDLNGSSSVIARGITIDGCGKLDLLMLKDCKNLKSLSGDVDVAELKIKGCPQLEELSSLSRVENLSILPGKKHECSNAAIRNSILKLQRVPSEGLVVIGSAVDGAKTMLSPHLFSEWITREAVIKCNIDRDRSSVFASPETMPERGSLSAIILVAVFESHRSGRVSVQIFGRDIYLNMGKWIVTAVCTDENFPFYIPLELCVSDGKPWAFGSTIEKAYMVTVKKGEEWETLSQNVVKIICDRLLKR